MQSGTKLKQVLLGSNELAESEPVLRLIGENAFGLTQVDRRRNRSDSHCMLLGFEYKDGMAGMVPISLMTAVLIARPGPVPWKRCIIAVSTSQADQ